MNSSWNERHSSKTKYIVSLKEKNNNNEGHLEISKTRPSRLEVAKLFGPRANFFSSELRCATKLY